MPRLGTALDRRSGGTPPPELSPSGPWRGSRGVALLFVQGCTRVQHCAVPLNTSRPAAHFARAHGPAVPLCRRHWRACQEQNSPGAPLRAARHAGLLHSLATRCPAEAKAKRSPCASEADRSHNPSAGPWVSLRKAARIDPRHVENHPLPSRERRARRRHQLPDRHHPPAARSDRARYPKKRARHAGRVLPAPALRATRRTESGSTGTGRS